MDKDDYYELSVPSKKLFIRFYSVLVICSILGFLTYCSPKYAHDTTLDSVNFDKKVFDHISMPLSQIAKTIEYVPLETTKESLFGRVRKAKFSNNYILIYDGDIQKLLLFRKDGSFVSSISHNGKGPEEYVGITDFDICEKENRIALSTVDKQVKLFNLDGSFEGSFKLDFFHHVVFDQGDHLLYYSKFPVSFYNQGYSVFSTDLEGKLLVTGLQRHLKEYPQGAMGGFADIYRFKDDITIWEAYFDTLWSINNNQDIIPKARFIYGDNYTGYNGFINANYFQLQKNGMYYLFNLIESNGYYFFKRSCLSKISYLLCDKDLGIVSEIKHDQENIDYGRGFLNDIDGFSSFWPIGGINSSQLYSFIELHELRNRLESQIHGSSPSQVENQKRLLELMDTIKDISNPIVIKVSLK